MQVLGGSLPSHLLLCRGDVLELASPVHTACRNRSKPSNMLVVDENYFRFKNSPSMATAICMSDTMFIPSFLLHSAPCPGQNLFNLGQKLFT